LDVIILAIEDVIELKIQGITERARRVYFIFTTREDGAIERIVHIIIAIHNGRGDGISF
jgi:hypothetical protein